MDSQEGKCWGGAGQEEVCACGQCHAVNLCNAKVQEQFVPCSFLHYGHCNVRHFQVFAVVFYKALRLYWPIHFLPLLLSKRTKLLTSRSLFKRWIRTSVLGTIRSCLFLASYAALFAVGMCFLRNRRKADSWLSSFFAGCFCGLSVVAEDPSRRAEVAIYCLPRVMEITYNGALKRGLVSLVPYGDVALFSGAMALLMYLFNHRKQQLKSGHKAIMRLLFGLT